MSVDPYALCPCGSGKKLKFCCSDLAGDIEKVHRMVEGDQPRAALAHVVQTLAKAPGRGSLLDLKATVELSLGELDEARATVDEFIRVDPQNPAAHAQAAIVAASHRVDPESDTAPDPAASVEPLQRALELLTDEMPGRVLQAIGAVGQALLVQGNLVAARAHLWLYQGIAGREDTRAMELLSRLNQVSGLPLLLRDHLYLREAPAGHACEAQLDHAQLLASRGQWRRAADAMKQLCDAHPDLATLAYNHGLVSGWLGETDRFVEGLRRFASLVGEGDDGLLGDDAVEAEAIAQLLDRNPGEAPTEVVRTTFAVADEEQLIDRLTRDKRADAYQLSESELQAIEGPPPRQTLLLLDRPLPESGVAITAEVTPRIVGFLSYYGRQTDRPERLELVADRDERHADTLKLVAELAGAGLGGVTDETVVGEAPSTEPTLRWRWHFPHDTPPAVRRDLMATERRRALLEDWPTAPKAVLGGKTPLEAAGDPALRTALAAAVLVLEQGSDGRIEPGVFAELREKIGLPAVEPIAPGEVDIEVLPLVRIGRVDLSTVDDEDLVALYERAMLAGANDAVVEIARVGIDRPGVVERLPADELYFRLVSYESDPAEARRWVERARQAAESTGKSSATWDILELELCVVGGELEEANRLVQHIRSEHLDEPGVAEQLYQLLYALGAVPGPDGMPAGGPEAPPAAESESASKLWTPDSGAPAASSEGGGESKIWTPS